MDPWYDLLTAVLLRAVEDAKLERTYGLHTPAMMAQARDEALRFLVHAEPLFDLVGIDHGAAVNALGFSWENTHATIDQTAEGDRVTVAAGVDATRNGAPARVEVWHDPSPVAASARPLRLSHHGATCGEGEQ